MSEENVTSTRNSNDKYYLGVIAALVLILFYLFFSKGGNAVAQTQQQTKQVPQEQAASQTDIESAQAASDARAIKEGWGAVPIDQKMIAWLKAHNIKTIAFVDDKLQLLIANPSGKEVPVCARPVGATGVTGKCTESSEPVRYSIELSLERRGDASTYCWKRGGSWVCM